MDNDDAWYIRTHVDARRSHPVHVRGHEYVLPNQPLAHSRGTTSASTMGPESFSRKAVVALALTAQLTSGFTNNGKTPHASVFLFAVRCSPLTANVL